MSVRYARIALATDFGPSPYVGQIRLSLAASLPILTVVDLVHDLPAFRPDLAAYLLPALIRDLPSATLYLCVVDPGVGGSREILVVEADGNGFIVPDNGLLAPLVRRAERVAVHRVGWRPGRMSDSFHGRDLLVPLAARLLTGQDIGAHPLDPAVLVGGDWPADHSGIVYRDRYGNLISGWRAGGLARSSSIEAGGRRLDYARTFCEVPLGTAFWYENAFGLVELAVNRGRADAVLGLDVGDPIRVLPGVAG